MAIEEKENQASESIEEQNSAAADENVSSASAPSELREARWSVVSFDRIEAAALTYAEAEQKLSELAKQKISGLCIITDEAAARVAKTQPSR